jgi:hypothetical protein
VAFKRNISHYCYQNNLDKNSEMSKWLKEEYSDLAEIYKDYEGS